MKNKKFLLLFISFMTALTIFGGCGSSKEKAASGDTPTEIPAFTLMTTAGDEVSKDIFKENEYTLVNVWATHCKPCIEELPILQKINDDKTNGLPVVGIVGDGNDNAPQANEMLKKLNVKFTNILPDQAFEEDFVTKQEGVPYSMIVDKDGKILKFVAGDQSEEEFRKMIDEVKKA